MNSVLNADFYYSGGKKHTLKKIKTSRSLEIKNNITFQMESGDTAKINKGLILSFSDKNVKKIVEQKYNLTFIKALSDNILLYEVKDPSKTIEISNKIYEEDGVKFCHPNFKISKKTRELTNDPLIYNSWHLFDHWYSNGGDINIEQAWRYTKGEGVKVAVYDKGIDIEHPDLDVYAFRNYNDPNSDVPYSEDDKSWHGTACAGILSAKENNIGSVGIAPEANLYAVGYSDNDIAQDISAFNWMMDEGVSVINNSWGSYSSLDAYTAIFKKLATEGRNGKGIIIIFAAGNEGRDLDQTDINDESESPYVFSIAASTRENKIATYSNYGNSVDFTTPGGTVTSGIITIDARGSLGYNDGNYNQHFMGTSAAAPIASGVVTLMLATNPKLTRDDVFRILKITADHEGDYSYDEDGYNKHWGYGKINAGKAVEFAHSYKNSKLKNFARTMFNALLN